VLTEVAKGISVHESEFCRSNAVVVQGAAGVLLVDAGVHETELVCLAGDLAESGHTVVAGFSTHPHWDHLLWHTALGDAPRYATARCAETIRERLAAGIDARRFGIPDDVPLDLLGLVAGLPAEATRFPWDGPDIAVVEHRAHAPGHAALLIRDGGVLVAGDLLSDVLVPMLDPNAVDPIEDYLAALTLIEDVADEVEVVVPGHGSVGGADRLRERIERDRAYVHALRDGREPVDPRIGPSAEPGWEWVSDVHAGQVRRLAERG